MAQNQLVEELNRIAKLFCNRKLSDVLCVLAVFFLWIVLAGFVFLKTVGVQNIFIAEISRISIIFGLVMTAIIGFAISYVRILDRAESLKNRSKGRNW